MIPLDPDDVFSQGIISIYGTGFRQGFEAADSESEPILPARVKSFLPARPVIWTRSSRCGQNPSGFHASRRIIESCVEFRRIRTRRSRLRHSRTRPAQRRILLIPLIFICCTRMRWSIPFPSRRSVVSTAYSTLNVIQGMSKRNKNFKTSLRRHSRYSRRFAGEYDS